jgi:hypothetical protein
MKKINFSIFLFALIFLMGCKKDEPTPCELLQGDWQCESWQQDGVELFGNQAGISSSRIDFDELPSSGGIRNLQGDFDWSINFSDGDSGTIVGKYDASCDLAGSEVTLTYNGVTSKLDFTILNDKLTLEGELFNSDVKLDFERD